jgi:hypothetical protein
MAGILENSPKPLYTPAMIQLCRELRNLLSDGVSKIVFFTHFTKNPEESRGR